MSDKQAFPMPACDGENFYHPHTTGMTLREWFAGMALQGAIASTAGDDSFPDTAITAKWAVGYADALIAELSKGVKDAT